MSQPLCKRTSPPRPNTPPPGVGPVRHFLRRVGRVLSELWVMKTPVLVFGTLLALLPLPLIVEGKESRCAYTLLVMAVLWLTEALPIPVTALLPVFMFPMTGILTAVDVGHSYFSNTSMLFIGGLVVAVGVEECNLHKRVALAVLRRVGADPKWIMLGLMLPTWFLSMWISNTATASMMVPIVEAVLMQYKNATASIPSDGTDNSSTTGAEESLEMEDLSEEGTAFLKHRLPTHDGDDAVCRVEIQADVTGTKGNGIPKINNKLEMKSAEEADTATDNDTSASKKTPQEDRQANLAKALCLCVAYSANVGGVATLTGTPPNLVLKGQVDMLFQKYGTESPLSFVQWMGLGFPLSLVLLVLCWIWLVMIFLHGYCAKVDERQKEAVKKTIQQEYKAMGSITFAEVETSVLFFSLAFLWISREPKFVPGWSVLFESGYVSDATEAILIAVLFFVLPAKIPRIFCCRERDGGEGEEVKSRVYQPLLTWERAQEKLPWGVIILLGGGFALAKACKFSGLSLLVGQQLTAFASLDPWLLNAIICIAVAMATEVTSNVATATLLMPIMAELAIRIQVNPIYLMSSSALATSFAFMMPVATPPNAIVFSHGHISIPDMAKTGFMMNVFAVGILVLAVNTWGDAIFGFSTLPDYMKNNITTTTPSP